MIFLAFNIFYLQTIKDRKQLFGNYLARKMRPKEEHPDRD